MTAPVEPPVEPPAVIGGRGIASVGVASLVAAASGYLILVVVARYLPTADNADFLVYWSLLFGGFAVLGGIMPETTRAVGAAGPDRSSGARVMPWTLLIGAAVALTVALTAPLWRGTLLGDESWSAVLLVCLSLLAFAGHLTMVGVLTGRGRWNLVSAYVGGESLLRLVLVVVAVLVGSEVFGLEVAVAASAGFWLVVTPWSALTRRAVGALADVGPRRLVGNLLHALLAAVGTAALVVGYPTLLRATTDSAQWATAAPLVLAISMTRAPLLIPLNAYQGVAIRYFLDPARRPGRALTRLSLLVVGAGVVGAGLAALLGPWLMTAVFGPDYDVAPEILAALMLAASTVAVLTLTGAAVLALGRHAAYAAGWIVAAGTSLLLLFVDLPLDQRAALSLAVGPLVGIGVHAFAVRSAVAAGGDVTSDPART
jgi:O-antigen/teichoic acid export membrane protein